MKAVVSGCLLATVILSSVDAVRLHWEHLPDIELAEDAPDDNELISGPDVSQRIIDEGDAVVKNSQFEGEQVDVIDILAYSSDGAD